MKKALFTTTAVFFLMIFGINAQETAMDFSKTDCDGVDHHLFSELDAGKVVILDFVMLNCAPCVVATNALVDLTAPYELTNPGRVCIYSIAFLNSFTCEQIIQWKRDFDYKHQVFSEGEDQVSYYGGMGMPTIVITGTNTHKVFYNGIGYTTDHDPLIKSAIDSALLYNPTGVGEKEPSGEFRIYPTVFTDRLDVETGQEYSGAEMIICDSFGRQVMTSIIPISGKTSLSVAGLSTGLYIVRVRSNHGISGSIRLIKQ